MIHVEQTTLDALFSDPDFPALVEEYKRHAIAEVSGGTPDLEFYRHLEQAPGVSLWSVRKDGKLTGFAALLLRYAPHSGAITATTETLFALEGGAVLRRKLAAYASSKGARVLLVAVPHGSRAAVVLGHAGMRPCTIVYAQQL